MNGIFNYQVPGRSTTRPLNRQSQPSFLDTPTLDQPARPSPFEEPVRTEIKSLLQKRLQQINDQPSSGSPLDIRTLALGEDDKGDIFFYPTEPRIFSSTTFSKEKRVSTPSSDLSLELTTKALGEEDGGHLPSRLAPSTAQPLELTTKALGEEDGFYR